MKKNTLGHFLQISWGGAKEILGSNSDTPERMAGQLRHHPASSLVACKKKANGGKVIRVSIIIIIILINII